MSASVDPDGCDDAFFRQPSFDIPLVYDDVLRRAPRIRDPSSRRSGRASSRSRVLSLARPLARASSRSRVFSLARLLASRVFTWRAASVAHGLERVDVLRRVHPQA